MNDSVSKLLVFLLAHPVFTLTPSKTLVECSSSVFSCIVFLRVCEDEKTFKHPMVNRVKSAKIVSNYNPSLTLIIGTFGT